MEQFEKVCKGLEELRNFADTKVHPIVSPENWGVYSDLCDLIDEFGTDALALIRQQQERIKELEAGQTARVMTLEEIKNANGYIWKEYKGMHAMSAVLIEYGMERVPFDRDYPTNEYNWPFYGKEWRCWTQRPTDEQRKAVKWE